ncbi:MULTISPECIES: glycosyltransferase family A protein [Pseudomonadota]|jgi:glycosyltransferase involved in cell wall biosynthesis|uniref:glycosyltransferase family A protein n=1 Tax=Shewanella sp. TaxID=50422 RepID=UPI004048C8D4
MNKNTTILIASYNHGAQLVYQLESLLNQTKPPKRIIVLDDGSTDDTQNILKSYRENNSICVISHQRNLGVHAAVSRLLSEVDTEFFAFASADDLLTQDWCQTMTSLLETHPDAKMAISNTFLVELGGVIETDLIRGPSGVSAGIFSPCEFTEAIYSSGKLPPSNTIMYRSDIISNLVLPIFSQQKLGPVVDVILILSIATQHPTAYSTKATGVFIKSPGSYSSLAVDVQFQREIMEHIQKVSHSGKLQEPDKFANFINRLLKYAWTRQEITRRQEENRANRTGLSCLWVAFALHTRTLATYLTFSRIQYLRLSSLRKRQRIKTLEPLIGERLLRRLNM